MRVTKRQLIKIINESMAKTYQSHTFEPEVGDAVVNVNPHCTHAGSRGIVVSVDDLPMDAGKTARYMCGNDGHSWDKGDILEKTLDQLAPLEGHHE